MYCHAVFKYFSYLILTCDSSIDDREPITAEDVEEDWYNLNHNR